MKNYISTIKFKLTNKLMKLISDSRGIGTIEMVLLIVVILGILVLFRDYIQALISSIFSKIDNQINNF
jgi:Flp pilus assembly pilin Flp